MSRRLFVNLAVAAATVLATLAVLEGLFRLAAPAPTFYTGRGLYQPDPELGHVLRPGLASGDVATNSFGFRGRERPLAKPPGTRRVLGLGDSFTFGNTFPRGVYLEVTEQRLAAAGLPFPVEVLNAGVPGYSTHQELGHLRKFGWRFAPDVVVLGLFPTGDVVENHSDELLEVVDGELVGSPGTELEFAL